jgi:membrane protease subunit HflC
VSEAQRDAEIIRGEADAARNRIFAEAFGRDQEFFEFYRSLTAYERALGGSNTSLVITPDSEFFEYLKSDTGRTPAAE